MFAAPPGLSELVLVGKIHSIDSASEQQQILPPPQNSQNSSQNFVTASGWRIARVYCRWRAAASVSKQRSLAW